MSPRVEGDWELLGGTQDTPLPASPGDDGSSAARAAATLAFTQVADDVRGARSRGRERRSAGSRTFSVYSPSVLDTPLLLCQPLNPERSSAWNAYFLDAEVREDIEKDVQRTRSDLHFFNGEYADVRLAARPAASTTLA